ncbi:Uncharacterized protein SCF082_LOCUS29801 [Durusdinium trenchii]|uniref:Uncharacterized protein n=1 Tax=Durusdinium trenchii TaxID=1381693 RepID=A0ABP0MUN2_9DINO
MFVPPPPKVVPPMPVVAPYVSDADVRKRLWELQMRQHLKALEGVTSCMDQSDPVAANVAVRKARERARDFARDEMRRDVVDGNKQLVTRLKEIVKKPSALVAETPPQSNTRYEMLKRDRQLRQRNIQNENKSLVRRILSVKSSVDRSGLEKDYWRHRKDVNRLQQIPSPRRSKRSPRAERSSSERADRFLMRSPRAPRQLEELPVRTPSAGSYRPLRQLPLPPMKGSSSAPQLVKEKQERPVPKKKQHSATSPVRISKSKIADETTPKVKAYVSSLIARTLVAIEAQKATPTAKTAAIQSKAQVPEPVEAGPVSAYISGLFARCVQQAQARELTRNEQVDSADVSRSSWMRSQEMAAAEFIAEQMTNEALEVMEYGEARSLMNDSAATWPSLRATGSGIWGL